MRSEIRLDTNNSNQHIYTDYRKTPKFLDTENVCCNQPKIQTKRIFHREICSKCADRMANSADPDQTAPCGAV